MKTILLSDITMKQYTEATGQKLTFKEKLEMARLLDRLNVPVIEFGALNEKKADALLIKSIAAVLENSILSVNAGLTEADIREAWDALKNAKKKRIQIEASLSSARMEYVYHLKADTMKEAVKNAVSFAGTLCEDVEFVAEDATRTDFLYLAEVLQEAIRSGARTITVLDNTGSLLPQEAADFIARLYEALPELKDSDTLSLGFGCQDDLNLAQAVAIEAALSGASEIKTSVLDLNTVSLPAFAGILNRKKEIFEARNINPDVPVRMTELGRTVQNIERLVKSVKNANSPFDDGVREYSEDLSYTSGDSLEEVMKGVSSLGYDLTESDKVRVYAAFKTIAERKEKVGLRELDVIVASEAVQAPDTYKLESYVVTTGNALDILAHVKLSTQDQILDGLSLGDGPVDAAFLAIEKITGRHYELDDFQIQSITEGREAMGQTVVKLRSGGHLYSGAGISTDIIGSAILAYLNALNKIVYEEEQE
ncbi:MAG: hypothetical protein IJL98_05870 [Lachnospiraceae bacterium]|nr:hypothetical protein [Lachnospiraceae bacterium]